MVTHRIYRRTLLSMGMVALVTGLAGLAVIEFQARDRLDRFVRDTARTVASQTARQVAQHALANDVLAMNLLLSSVAEDPSIRSAQLFGVDNRLIAAAGDLPGPLAEVPTAAGSVPDTLVLVKPVHYDNVLAGHLRLTWDLAALQGLRTELRGSLAGVTLLMVLVALGIGDRIGRRLATQADRLGASLEAAGLPTGESGSAGPADEFSALAGRVEHWIGKPGDNPAAPEPGADHPDWLPNRPEAELCAVLAMEPVDLHELLNQFEAEQLNGQLRRAYEFVRRSASLYQARHCLIEHNRVLVLFTGGSDDEPEMFRAICAARLIQQLLQRMRSERTSGNSPQLHFRALVHAGPVRLPESLSGEVHLAELDGSGSPVVRLAVRMLEHAGSDETLVSAAAIDHPTVLEKTTLGGARNARTRESGNPLALFPVTALAPGYEILQERQGENLLYAARSY